MRINPKYIKYIRPAIAILILLLGGVFMFIPFIPLGYVLLFAGLMLLVPYIPFIQIWVDRLKKKDKKNILARTEHNISEQEEKLYKWVERTNRKQRVREFSREEDMPC